MLVSARSSQPEQWRECVDSLLCVEGYERQIQQNSQPISIDKEEECQECVNGGFGNNVGVEAVAEIDRVDVVAVREQSVIVSCGRRMEEPTIPDRCT